MITERELLQAIRECEAEPITPSKVGKLADFYIIYDHLFGEPFDAQFSQTGAVESVVSVDGDSDFLKAVSGKNSVKAWSVMDELMEATKALHPRMYNRVIEKISDL